MMPLRVRPPIHRSTDLGDDDRLVARVGERSAEGYPDRALAEHLTAEGVRSARHPDGPTTLVRRLRRKPGHTARTAPFRGQEQIGGLWTVWGLSRALQVDRNWRYARIHAGRIPATRHPILGHYLIPDEPPLWEHLRAQRPPCRQR
jgi:hypothetical protein